MPFYKKDEGQLLVAETRVIGPGFELYAESHQNHDYPIEGWYWFDTLDEAMANMAEKKTVLSVSRRQGRKALLQTLSQDGTKTLLDQVELHIASIQDPIQKKSAEIDYEADTWEITNPFLVQTWTLLTGSEEGLQEFFNFASTL